MLRTAALAVAHSDARRILREAGGANRGTYIEAILNNAGISGPAPWCAAWVQDVYDSAALACGMKNPLDEVRLQGLVQAYHNWAYMTGRLLSKAADIMPGDLVLYNFGGERYDHIGIVLEPPETLTAGSEFLTIEGNTNDGGSREGDRVAYKKRKIVAARTSFIRIE
jgi:hypothetical protein